MSEIWMFTAPFNKKEHIGILKELKNAWSEFDGKKYVIGYEKGRNGYRHIQGRIQISANTDYKIVERIGKHKTRTRNGSRMFDKLSGCGIHCEKTEQWTDYESKDGYFISSDDTMEVRAQRFGTHTEDQKAVLRLLESNNDREVTVWYDQTGNVGKSWLTGHLWERHKAHYIRMTGSAESMIKDTCSKMSKERRPIVIIDIPRATKWNNDLYQAIEVIKDGLIDDPRYSSNAINIRGTKVLIMCNTKPKLDKLSEDRWIFYNAPVGATRADAHH